MGIHYSLLSPGDEQPSAITSLLQQMAGPAVIPQGGPLGGMPAPQAAPSPPMPQPQQPHMLQRIAGLLGSLGGGVAGAAGGAHDFLVDHTGGQTPLGVDQLVSAGLLSPDDVQRAKPGLLSLIAGSAANTPGGGQAAYQNNINNILKVRGDVHQLVEQKRLDAVRANMAAQFTPKPGASQDDIRDLNEQMFAYAIRNRDPETAKLLETSNVEAMKRVKTPTAVLHEGPKNSWWDLTDPKNPKQIVAGDTDAKNKQIVNAVEGIFEVRPDGLYDAATQQKYTGKTLHPVPLAPSYSPVTLGGQNGTPPVVVPFDNKSGVAGKPIGLAKPAAGAGGLAAPMASKVGQFGEMLKKADDLIPAAEAMQVSLASSAAQDIAAHGIGAGSARIPGTAGLGSMMLNRNPDYAKYQAALSPFILAAAHALSGARINQDQVAQIRESIEIKPGDMANPKVVAQKQKNLLDLINSIGGSLPADAVSAQEQQMGDEGIQRMVGRGYLRRSATGPATPAASGGGKTVTVNGKTFKIPD